VFAGVTLPPDYLQALTNQLGAFPKEDSLKPTRNDWTTDALIAQWADGVPDFSFLWMNEPDATQHRTGPGSEQSLAAIRNSDQNLARVLAALETKGVRDVTDLFVVSDHGCSTIFNKADLADGLRRIGLMATREFKSKPAPGEVLIVSNSGSTMVYVIGHHQEVIERVVEFLQAWPHTGVIFTRKPMSGTFPLSQVHLDSGDAPDLVVSMRWTDGKNSNGTAGIVTPDSTSYNSGQGIHVTLSPFDMHATLIAAGPDFRTGTQSTVPSGNVDVAPTVLWILGIKPATKMDGRVLSEALTSPGEPIRESEPRLFQATRKLEGGTWRQYLKVSQVNGVDYFDEGNGAQTPK
jgi:arylsulfatase A-like enzyme